MDKRLVGPGARLAAIARRVGPEPCFAEAKLWRGLRRAKYRGLEKFQGQVLLTATAQNLRKFVKWTWRSGQGAGRASWKQAQSATMLTVNSNNPPANQALVLTCAHP